MKTINHSKLKLKECLNIIQLFLLKVNYVAHHTSIFPKDSSVKGEGVSTTCVVSFQPGKNWMFVQ